jgi:GR25 family glycosyltransferase involved in LPS biosynthesis
MTYLNILLSNNYDIIFDLYKNNKLKLEEENKFILLEYVFEKYLSEYKNNLKKYNTTQDKNVDMSFIKLKNIFELLHGYYSKYNIENVKNVCFVFNKNKNDVNKEITITTTTCKRLDLFKKTVNSFIECCKDLHLVKEWIVIDDNSSENDRIEMKILYPFITFVFKDEFDKGHVKSMNILKNMIKTKYIFNLEDDWEFIYKDNYLTKCIDVINIKPEYGQCLINKNYGEGDRCFETVGGILKSYVKEDFVQQFYFEHEYIDNNASIQLELQKYIYLRTQREYKSQYYWPHFSLRVGLTKMSVLKELGDFEHVPHFEMNYAIKYNQKNYKTAFLESLYCSHIGRRTYERFDKNKPNAYELNKVNQFSQLSNQNEEVKEDNKKEVKEDNKNLSHSLNDIFKTFVVNLKRRPDRLNDFYNKNKHILPLLDIEVEEAVDGENIILNQKIRKIFHTSDALFRKGIMGCAFSHMKLWGKLVNDKTHDIYLVLEDDVLMSNSSEVFLKYITEQILDKIPEWDVLFLGNHVKKERKETQVVIQKYNPEQFMDNSYGGTFCYLIHKRGAIKLLTNLIANGMNYAIDWDMCRLDCMNNYFMYPLLAFSQMANDLPTNDSDIQKSQTRFNSSVHDWILEDIEKMIDITSNKGILYFERDNWNNFIYDKFSFDCKSNIIVSNELINKNLLFTNICFTQIWYDNSKLIQDLLSNILEQKIPVYFYTIYERYLVTVPESLYNKYENIKKYFSFINKIDYEYII